MVRIFFFTVFLNTLDTVLQEPTGNEVQVQTGKKIQPEQEILIFSQWPETSLRYVEEEDTMKKWIKAGHDYCNNACNRY